MERFRGAGCPEQNKLNQNTKPQEQGGEQKEGKECQELPNVWEVLERDARLWGRRMEDRKYDREREKEYNHEESELKKLEDELKEKGTDRDRLILNLHYTTYTNPSSPFFSTNLTVERSLKAFQMFRLWTEQMSDKKIAKAIEHEENQAGKRPKNFRPWRNSKYKDYNNS